MERKAGGRLPFRIFPGIFSSIDSYSKSVVHSWLDRHGGPPAWLAGIGEVVGYRTPPGSSTFRFTDEATNVVLTGAPDAVFDLADGSLLIADYKTARVTDTQDALLPVYRTQLNAYALIAERTGLGRVSRLALVYTEPVTGPAAAARDAVHREDGFEMGFSARILPVELDFGSIPPLLERARRILDLAAPPGGRPGCKECEKLRAVIGLVQAGSGDAPATVDRTR